MVLIFKLGFKFETLYTIPDIWDNVSREEIEGRDEKVVDNHPQYCSVVKTSIGETSMIIGGEVDCSKLTFVVAFKPIAH